MTRSFFAIRDRGRKRATNQDQAVAIELPDGYVLLLVADGVGGAKGGEVASAEAVRAMADAVRTMDSEPGERLLAAARIANGRVRAAAAGDGALSGMASTLVAALVKGRSATVASVGDSRAYRCTRDGLEQLTRDDSWFDEQTRSGRMTEAEAARSPYRNAITRGIGVSDAPLTLTAIPVELDRDEPLLLCSDGLYRALSAETIARVLRGMPADRAAMRLVDLANEAGGPDNISVAIYRSG